MITLTLAEIAQALNLGPLYSPYHENEPGEFGFSDEANELDDIWHEGFSYALDLAAEAVADRLDGRPGFNREAFLRDCGHSGFSQKESSHDVL